MLAACGWVNFGMIVLMCVFLAIDGREVAGVNPWLKPIKYAFALGLYAWTLSAILSLIEDFETLRAVVAKIVAGLVLVQTFVVSIQAAGGVESHFNITTTWDRWNFAILGVSSALNTVFAAMIFALVLTNLRSGIAPAIAWGARLGLALFIAAGFQGVQIILHQSHTVGGRDGGAGLPLLNWSTAHGDLRVAHVFGVLALPIIPLAGWAVSRFKWPPNVQRIAVAVIGIAYAALAWYANSVAMAGRPFLR